MRFTLEMIVFLFFMTLLSVALILDHADSKNESYLQTAATEAMLRVPPSGYITPQIQEDIRGFLLETRGMNPVKVTIEGTTSLSERKVRGSSDEMIELSISYPRQTIGLFGGVTHKEYRATRQILTEYRP
ncbi:hypothetical protein [Paenibacillus sp. y28]|uniref:hypothetical protein n=1 Tax=Paenibacillus sp. y28 TaxID=3129110 RepID=UPI00301AC52C